MATSWQGGEPFDPRPASRLVVYVPKQQQETHLVDRLKDHARRVDQSPSAVVMTACERYLDQCAC